MTDGSLSDDKVAPDAAVTHFVELARQATSNGSASQAIALLEQAEALDCLDPTVQSELAQVYRLMDRELDAVAASIAADALVEKDAIRLYNLATGYFQHGHPAAEKWYRVVLLMSPSMAPAHQNLAALLRNRGDWREADRHVELAYRNQWVFVERASQPCARVLMACAGGLGNVPTDTLLPAHRFTLIKCMVDYQRDDDDPPLGDILFNVVADPDCRTATSPALAQFLESSGLHVLNQPSRVLATRRDRLAATLASLIHVVVPHVERFDATASNAEVAKALGSALLSGPLIMRCAESHGGDSVALISDTSALECWLTEIRSSRAAGSIYATKFVDSRSADQNFRKYRVIFIGGRPYPYHLAISSNWMVHYFSAGMTEAAWKLEEERHFLEDPSAVLGSVAWDALSTLGARVGLDYFGIDFTLDHGEILVFEANATMIIHREPADGPLAHKNQYVDAIVAAFQDLVIGAARTEREPAVI